jgi:poly-gamma-glutamate synthesis protein (capsule biosynthesis protein)
MSRRAALLLAGIALGCERPAQGVASSDTGAVAAPEEPAIAFEPFGPPAPPPPSEPLRVLVAGDLIPHRPSLSAPSAVLSALAPMANVFEKADMVVANYEAATGELEKKAFRLAYAAPPAWLEALPLAGIKAVSVANNHACDLGYEGVEATLDAASKSGLTVLGGDAKGDPWAPRTLVERDGKRVCAVAWTTLVNAEGGCAKSKRLAVATENAAGRQKVAAALQRARDVCDATIAILHGGVEYVQQTPTVMAVARQAADSGADAVVIHHPHTASPVVVHSTKDGRKIPIFASVGNLVSNQGESWKPPMFPVLRENRRLVCVNGWTRLGVLADLTFDFKAAPTLDWSFHLLWTDNEHAENKAPVPKIATRLLDPDKDAAILSRLSDDQAGPVDLFDDPCWVERPIYTDGDREAVARCRTSLVRGAPQASPAMARAKKTKALGPSRLTGGRGRTIRQGACPKPMLQ